MSTLWGRSMERALENEVRKEDIRKKKIEENINKMYKLYSQILSPIKQIPFIKIKNDKESLWTAHIDCKKDSLKDFLYAISDDPDFVEFLPPMGYEEIDKYYRQQKSWF